jgi:hypothetical protein
MKSLEDEDLISFLEMEIFLQPQRKRSFLTFFLMLQKDK